MKEKEEEEEEEEGEEGVTFSTLEVETEVWKSHCF